MKRSPEWTPDSWVQSYFNASRDGNVPSPKFLAEVLFQAVVVYMRFTFKIWIWLRWITVAKVGKGRSFSIDSILHTSAFGECGGTILGNAKLCTTKNSNQKPLFLVTPLSPLRHHCSSPPLFPAYLNSPSCDWSTLRADSPKKANWKWSQLRSQMILGANARNQRSKPRWSRDVHFILTCYCDCYLSLVSRAVLPNWTWQRTCNNLSCRHRIWPQSSPNDARNKQCAQLPPSVVDRIPEKWKATNFLHSMAQI